MDNKIYFEHLSDNLPELKARFNSFIVTSFDDSMTVEMQLRALVKWIKKNIELTNDMVDYLNKFIETFDERLGQTVNDILEKWVNDGILTEVILNFLVKYRDQYYVNAGAFGLKEEGDMTTILQELINRFNYLYIPGGTYNVKNIKISDGKKYIIGDYERSYLYGDCKDGKPIITYDENVYTYDVVWENIGFKGDTQKNLVVENKCSNVQYIKCIFKGDDRRLATGVEVNQASYYTQFNSCKFVDLYQPYVINDKSNAGTVYNSLIYNNVHGGRYGECNGWKTYGNTFQDYDYEGVVLGGDKYTSQNVFYGNYFERLASSKVTDFCGIRIEEDTGVYYSFGNKYSDLPTKKGFNNAKGSVDLDYSGGTFKEPTRITPFLKVDPKPLSYTNYSGDSIYGSVNLFYDEEKKEKDKLKVLTRFYTGDNQQWKNFEWQDVLTVGSDNTLKWQPYTINGLKGLYLYHDSVLKLPTGNKDVVGNLVYDENFKTPKLYTGSEWVLVETNKYGSTLPKTYQNGGKYFLTSDFKTYTYFNGSWYDALGNKKVGD